MIDGFILIGSRSQAGTRFFPAIDPVMGETIDPPFESAGAAEVTQACAFAKVGFDSYAATTPDERARFLEAIASDIVAIADDLIVRAAQKRGLPRARLESERGRAIGQLRPFAAAVRQGGWLDTTIDPALADRQLPPRPDLRRVRVPLGPLAA